MTAPNPASITDRERSITHALMKAMECDVDSDTDDRPGIWPREFWFCSEHDWYEADCSDGICGYALKLARAAEAELTARDEAVRREAWDEGVVAAHRSPLTLFAIKQVNPYRAEATPHADAEAGS